MEFAKYNIPLEKIRVNEAGYINVGKCRPRTPRTWYPTSTSDAAPSTSTGTSRSCAEIEQRLRLRATRTRGNRQRYQPRSSK